MDTTQTVLAAWAASSADASKVSNTIKGLATAASGFIVLFVALALHIQLNPTDVLTFIAEASAAIGFIWSIAGFIVKIVHAVAKQQPVNLGFVPSVPVTPTDAAA